MKNKACCWVLIGIGVFILLMIVSTSLFVAAAFRSGGGTEIQKNSYLMVDVSGIIAEHRTAPLMIVMRSKTSTMMDIIRSLEYAAEDPKIIGVILRPNNCGGFADIRELRTAIEKFKKSKKPVYAYMDMATDRDYYLASVADSIYVSPSRAGGLVMLGLSVSRTYLARTFEKIGLKFHVIHVGQYKGAYENFERENMSESLRTSLQSLLDDLYATYTKETAESRRDLEWADLDREVMCGTNPLITGSNAVSKKMADAALDWGDVRERLMGSDSTLRVITPVKYVKSKSFAQDGKKEIAVLFASGEIAYRARESGIMEMEEGISSDRMVRQLRELREDDNVKAVVLRVNSPGGSALASEIIANEVRRLKAVKPVVVSMGNVAASGGYYIACLADRIVAQPNTITGSIGVVGMFPTAEELYRKIGARVETVEKGKWGQFFRIDRDLTGEQSDIILDMMSGVYDEFTERVAEGRKIGVEQVKAVAEGRVWTGSQALERKLVDELGGLDVAIERAKELAKISTAEKVRIRHYPRAEELLDYLLRQLNVSIQQIRSSMMTPEQREVQRAMDYLDRYLEDREFIQTLMPMDVPGYSSWYSQASGIHN